MLYYSIEDICEKQRIVNLKRLFVRSKLSADGKDNLPQTILFAKKPFLEVLTAGYCKSYWRKIAYCYGNAGCL